MQLLGVMHVCDLKENTSSAFFKYSKNITLTATVTSLHEKGIKKISIII
jgi:hypothetical protein